MTEKVKTVIECYFLLPSFKSRGPRTPQVNPLNLYAYSALIHSSSDQAICPIFDGLFDFDSYNRMQSDSHLFKAA